MTVRPVPPEQCYKYLGLLLLRGAAKTRTYHVLTHSATQSGFEGEGYYWEVGLLYGLEGFEDVQIRRIGVVLGDFLSVRSLFKLFWSSFKAGVQTLLYL